MFVRSKANGAQFPLRGRMTLNAQLLELPKELGKFVIVHELLHILAPITVRSSNALWMLTFQTGKNWIIYLGSRNFYIFKYSSNFPVGFMRKLIALIGLHIFQKLIGNRIIISQMSASSKGDRVLSAFVNASISPFLIKLLMNG
jgi:hypothetical protein